MNILIYGRFSNQHCAIRNVILSICKGLNEKYDFTNNKITVLTNREHADSFSEFVNFSIDLLDIPADSASKNQFYTLFKLPSYIKKHKIDLVIFPQITFYYFKKCKTVFYLHDLIEYSVKNAKSLSLRLRKFFYRRAAKISDAIITVSENSKKDIVNILHYPEEKISVLYDGRDESLVPIDKEKAFDKIKEDFSNIKQHYLLYVGYLAHPQKNLLFVLDNISEILLKNNLQFILVGPDGKDAELIHQKIADVNNKVGKQIVLTTGPVKKEQLPYFYSGAEAFIFVSQYEGFGMPVLEAMACGCPFITSNGSSLKEIANGYGELISPDDSEGLKTKLSKILEEGRKLPDFYKPVLAKFTWENHVDGLITVLNAIKK